MNLKMRFLLFLICHADKLVLHNTPFETYIKCVGSKAKINIRFESGCISGPTYGDIMINDKAGLTRDDIVTILKPMGKLLDEWNEFDDGVDGSVRVPAVDADHLGEQRPSVLGQGVFQCGQELFIGQFIAVDMIVEGEHGIDVRARDGPAVFSVLNREICAQSAIVDEGDVRPGDPLGENRFRIRGAGHRTGVHCGRRDAQQT